MNTGRQLTNATPRLQRRLGVEAGGLLAADRQVADQHVGAGAAQLGGDVDRGSSDSSETSR